MPNKINLKSLSVLAYANGFTHWHYKITDETSAMLMDCEFWQCDMINPGDIVMCVSPTLAVQFAMLSIDGRITPVIMVSANWASAR